MRAETNSEKGKGDKTMTREEAIKVLENNKPTIIFEDEETQHRISKLTEALDMAISALSKVDNAENPKCDLISRTEAIKAVYRKYPYNAEQNKCDEMVDALKALPSAEPKAVGDIVSRGDTRRVVTVTEPSDVISRADVLGYIDRVQISGLGRNKALDYIHKYVERTESAKPSGDLIGRSDAIEAVKKEIQDFEKNYMHGEDDENFGHDIGFVAGLHRAKEFIRSLPSADAEQVVRCGYCKHMRADGYCYMFADDRIRPSASDFCSYGERKAESEVEE